MQNRDLEKVVKLESSHGLGSMQQLQNVHVVEAPNDPRWAQELQVLVRAHLCASTRSVVVRMISSELLVQELLVEVLR